MANFHDGRLLSQTGETVWLDLNARLSRRPLGFCRAHQRPARKGNENRDGASLPSNAQRFHPCMLSLPPIASRHERARHRPDRWRPKETGLDWNPGNLRLRDEIGDEDAAQWHVVLQRIETNGVPSPQAPFPK